MKGLNTLIRGIMRNKQNSESMKGSNVSCASKIKNPELTMRFINVVYKGKGTVK